MKNSSNDPKGLIYESYRIENISESECRSIFLDWALSIPAECEMHVALRGLLDQYEPDWPDHPMTRVIAEGLKGIATPRRRGGWRSRPRS